MGQGPNSEGPMGQEVVVCMAGSRYPRQAASPVATVNKGRLVVMPGSRQKAPNSIVSYRQKMGRCQSSGGKGREIMVAGMNGPMV